MIYRYKVQVMKRFIVYSYSCPVAVLGATIFPSTLLPNTPSGALHLVSDYASRIFC